MTDTTDIKALRDASRREKFENQAAQYEKCSLSFIISLRNKEGGYSNEKIDDMWYGFKLAVSPPWGRTVGEVAIESNRLFHEKKALLDQLEAERQRAEALQGQLDYRNAVLTRAIRQREAAEADTEHYRKAWKDKADELAALKGDQVPVAVIQFSKHRELPDGSKPDWNEMPKVLSCNWLPDGTYDVYLHPQKPVVLPQAHKIRAGVTLTGDERNVMIPCDDGNWLSRLDVEHSIKMAGGIVKDGE